MSLRGLVKRLPYPIKQGLKYAYGSLPPRIRYGKVFWETYNFLQESQWWSWEKLEEYNSICDLINWVQEIAKKHIVIIYEENMGIYDFHMDKISKKVILLKVEDGVLVKVR